MRRIEQWVNIHPLFTGTIKILMRIQFTAISHAMGILQK